MLSSPLFARRLLDCRHGEDKTGKVKGLLCRDLKEFCIMVWPFGPLLSNANWNILDLFFAMFQFSSVSHARMFLLQKRRNLSYSLNAACREIVARRKCMSFSSTAHLLIYNNTSFAHCPVFRDFGVLVCEKKFWGIKHLRELSRVMRLYLAAGWAGCTMRV